MGKVILFLIGLFLYFNAVAQPAANSLVAKVDKRVELLSIVFRLATDKELSDTLNPAYSKKIYNHFRRFSDHPFIHYIKNISDSFLKNSIDIGAWEIPSLAVHISQPPFLQPLVTFSDTVSMDSWDNRALLNEKVILLLQQFYKDVDCETFFLSQKKYYDEINQLFEKQMKKINKKWCEDFFGLPTTENYYGILGLQGIGKGNYMRVNFKNNRRNTFTLFGFDSFDKNGMPVNLNHSWFAKADLHEYIHAFTNQLVDNNIKALQQSAEEILTNTEVWEKVKGTFYNNWQYILYESLVRACTIQYLKDNNEKDLTQEEIAIQEKAGFSWMKGLVEELERYKQNRKQYRNIEKFMPQIINYFKKVAAQINNTQPKNR